MVDNVVAFGQDGQISLVTSYPTLNNLHIIDSNGPNIDVKQEITIMKSILQSINTNSSLSRLITVEETEPTLEIGNIQMKMKFTFWIYATYVNVRCHGVEWINNNNNSGRLLCKSNPYPTFLLSDGTSTILYPQSKCAAQCSGVRGGGTNGDDVWDIPTAGIWTFYNNFNTATSEWGMDWIISPSWVQSPNKSRLLSSFATYAIDPII